jgi:predicted transcriptional regulator
MKNIEDAGTDEIKRLLVLLLVKLGSSSDEIAAALQVDPSVVRKMVPSRKVKKLDFIQSKSS